MNPFLRISLMFHILFCLLPSPFAISDSEQHPPLSPDNAEKPYLIRQITFEGLEHLNRKQLSKLIGMDAGQPYLPAEMVAGLNRVLEKYRESGFVFASIKPEVTTIPPIRYRFASTSTRGHRPAQARSQLKEIICFRPATSVGRSVYGKERLSAKLPLRVGLTKS